MIDLFKYELRTNYPHMKPRDVAIYERFVIKYPELYKEVQYDFHVGDKPEFDTSIEGIADAKQYMLYQLKIDVLGHTDNRIDILEIKPSAGPATIGQVQGYKALYLRDEKPNKNVGMVIVTNEEKLNMRFLCQQAGVTLYIV